MECHPFAIAHGRSEPFTVILKEPFAFSVILRSEATKDLARHKPFAALEARLRERNNLVQGKLREESVRFFVVPICWDSSDVVRPFKVAWG